MKLKKLLDNLNKLVEENSKYLNFEVVYSSDDEGNSFHKIYHVPSVGHFDVQTEEFDDGEEKPNKLNAICIN